MFLFGKRLTLLLMLCTYGTVYAQQGTISFGPFTQVSANRAQIDVFYTNPFTFTPDNVYLEVKVNDAPSIHAAAAPNNAGWGSTILGGNRVRFSGGVNASNWSNGSGSQNKIGTITFNMFTSGCVDLESSDGEFISFSPFQFLLPADVESDFRCRIMGFVNPAEGNGLASGRARRVEQDFGSGSGLTNSADSYSFGQFTAPRSSTGAIAEVDEDFGNFAKFNGNVDVSDMVAIQRNILGIESLTSTELVAGDVNQNGLVSTQDILIIQAGLLGTSTAGMTSAWVYPTSGSANSIPAGSQFISYDKSYTLDDKDLASFDFTAVKSGDANPDITPYDKSGDRQPILIANQPLKKGNLTKVPVYLNGTKQLEVFSMALSSNSSSISIEGVNSAAMDIDPETDFVIDEKGGRLNMIWFDKDLQARDFNKKQPAFYLLVKANRDVDDLSTALQLSSDKVESRVFTRSEKKSDEIREITLEWFDTIENDANDVNSLSVISVNNPFQDILSFQIDVTSFKTVDILLFDLNGRQILNRRAQVAIGSNNISISWGLAELPSGTYVYRIANNSEILASGKLSKF